MSQRPTFRPYNEYQQRQRNIVNHKDEFGPKLFKQMVVGFVCAGLLGLILLILGAVFMKDALKSEYSISVMLCVFGMGKNQLVRVLFLSWFYCNTYWSSIGHISVKVWLQFSRCRWTISHCWKQHVIGIGTTDFDS